MPFSPSPLLLYASSGFGIKLKLDRGAAINFPECISAYELGSKGQEWLLVVAYIQERTWRFFRIPLSKLDNFPQCRSTYE